MAVEEDALVQDASEYAADIGISLNEALQRLKLQPAVGELDELLTDKESGTFAGLWIQHEPDFRVVAQFTRDGGSTIRPYVEGGPLEQLVDVRTASVSLAELEATAAASRRAVDGVGVRVESQINVFQNRVELFVEDAELLEESVRASGRVLPAEARVIETDTHATLDANIYAGLPLSQCTSGFSVQHSSGTRGITTAAHCSNSISYDGTGLPFQDARYGGSHDVQWHTTPGYTDRPWAQDGIFDSSTPYYRVITGTEPRSQQALQTFVCKFGKTTGRTCGYIISKSYNPDIAPNSNSTWIRVHRDGVNLSGSGDSGGPYYVGNVAYGIHHCGIGNDACYMAINYVSGLSLGTLVQ